MGRCQTPPTCRTPPDSAATCADLRSRNITDLGGDAADAWHLQRRRCSASWMPTSPNRVTSACRVGAVIADPRRLMNQGARRARVKVQPQLPSPRTQVPPPTRRWTSARGRPEPHDPRQADLPLRGRVPRGLQNSAKNVIVTTAAWPADRRTASRSIVPSVREAGMARQQGGFCSAPRRRCPPTDLQRQTEELDRLFDASRQKRSTASP